MNKNQEKILADYLSSIGYGLVEYADPVDFESLIIELQKENSEYADELNNANETIKTAKLAIDEYKKHNQVTDTISEFRIKRELSEFTKEIDFANRRINSLTNSIQNNIQEIDDLTRSIENVEKVKIVFED